MIAQLIFIFFNFLQVLGYKSESGQFVLRRDANFDIGDAGVIQWKVLEPLPLGDYGCDITESQPGGIFNLVESKMRILSEMADGAFATWKTVNGTVNSQDHSFSATFDFKSTLLSAKINQDYYGVGGSAWRGWATTAIKILNPMSLLFEIRGGGVRFFYLDSWDQVFMADPYRSGFSQTAVHLSPGVHQLFVPFTSYSPEASFDLNIRPVSNNVEILDDLLVPDALDDGILVSPFFSVTVKNNMLNSVDDLKIVIREPGRNREIAVTMVHKLEPGQILPATLHAASDFTFDCTHVVNLRVDASINAKGKLATRDFQIRCRSSNQAYRFTFLDGDNTVHKAAAYPPSGPCPDPGCPIIFTTHGAGVECDSDAWTNAYRQQRGSWILFPSNRRNYGYDWEGPGFINGINALQYFSAHIPRRYRAMKADATRLLFSGHSMGGHGCLLYTTLMSDYAIGFACASGWLRRELYVSTGPFSVGASWVPPEIEDEFKKTGSSFAPDHLISNIQNIPALMRVGGQDDVVPAWGLRRYARMINELNDRPNFVVMTEIPNGGHWFDGIVNDDVIQEFFDRTVAGLRPALPKTFQVRVARASHYSGRGGLRVLRQQIPWKNSILDVQRIGVDEIWNILPKNVEQFSLVFVPDLPAPQEVIIYGQRFPVGSLSPNSSFIFKYIAEDMAWSVKKTAGNAQLDALPIRLTMFEALTSFPLIIVHPFKNANLRREAIYISQVMYYQGRHSTGIMDDSAPFLHVPSNLLLVGTEVVERSNVLSNTDVSLDSKNKFSMHGRLYEGDQFALLIRVEAPHPNRANRQIIAVIGNSNTAVARVLRQFLPLTSAMKTPDYIIVDTHKSASRGLGGVVAAGMIH